MHQIFQKEYGETMVSVITTNNEVVDQDMSFITNKKQILKLGKNLSLCIEGPTVDRVELEQKLQEFMQSSVFYPLLIRDFFSDTILKWDEFLEITEKENVEEIYEIYMDIVEFLKKEFTNRNLTGNKKYLSSLNILATVFPDEDYDIGEIFQINNKNTESLLLIWNHIQNMLHNVFDTFYSSFSEIFNNKSAEDFQSGKYEDYLNLKLDQETVKIGFYKHSYQEIIRKSLDVCYDIYELVKESTEFEDQIASFKKFTDQDYSDICILADIFPHIIKKIRHIASGDAVKEVEKVEISELKEYLKELLSSDILNYDLWITIEGILNDDLLDGMLDDFLDDSDCKDSDWTDKQYSCYTIEQFNPEFKVYRHKLSNKILNHYLPLVYCANGYKYGDCTHATSKDKTCPYLHVDGFRLNISEKYVVLTNGLENITDGRIFYSEEIAAKIFETVRSNYPEHKEIYQLCKNGRNTLYLFEGRICEHTYVYTIPPRESEITSNNNDSSENVDSLENSLNESSIETQQEVNPISETQQEVNPISETQQEVNPISETHQNPTSSVKSKIFNISFIDNNDDESDDENDESIVCDPVENVWNTTERLTTILENDKEDEVKDDNQTIVSEVPSNLESVKENDSSSSSYKCFVLYEGTKIFLNKRTQELISDGRLVEVLEYAGNNNVKCRVDDQIIICDPLEDFVNFKKFAKICHKKYLERKNKMQAPKESMKKINLGKIVTEDNSFLSVVSKKDSISSNVSSVNEKKDKKYEDNENFPSLEVSKTIPSKKVYCIPTTNSLPFSGRPNLNPCSHFLSKGSCRYNDKCQFDHVVFCKQFYTYGICNKECSDYHPEELKKLVIDKDVNTILGESGEFYDYWRKLYIPEICRAKYTTECSYKNCKRFHFKSTK